MEEKREIRRFLIIGAVLLLIWGLWPLVRGEEPRFFVLPLAGAAVAIALYNPMLARGFYQGWMAVAERIGQGVSYVVLFLLFWLLITPIALLLRIAGKDPLRRSREEQGSYWIDRKTPPGPMNHQF